MGNQSAECGDWEILTELAGRRLVRAARLAHVVHRDALRLRGFDAVPSLDELRGGW